LPTFGLVLPVTVGDPSNSQVIPAIAEVEATRKQDDTIVPVDRANTATARSPPSLPDKDTTTIGGFNSQASPQLAGEVSSSNASKDDQQLSLEKAISAALNRTLTLSESIPFCICAVDGCSLMWSEPCTQCDIKDPTGDSLCFCETHLDHNNGHQRLAIKPVELNTKRDAGDVSHSNSRDMSYEKSIQECICIVKGCNSKWFGPCNDCEGNDPKGETPCFCELHFLHDRHQGLPFKKAIGEPSTRRSTNKATQCSCISGCGNAVLVPQEGKACLYNGCAMRLSVNCSADYCATCDAELELDSAIGTSTGKSVFSIITFVNPH
jgi:hypothetical protein